MWWERWRIPIMLAPTLAIILILFVGSLGYGFLQSLGWQPNIGQHDINLDSYINIISSDQYSEQFWRGLLLTLWVAFASTFLAAALAVVCALLLRQTFVGKRLATFLFQLNLPIPHLVAAIGMLFLLSRSGLIGRGFAELGLIQYPSEFPVLVRDKNGFGIILAYTWKEMPFIGVIVLANHDEPGAEDVASRLLQALR